MRKFRTSGNKTRRPPSSAKHPTIAALCHRLMHDKKLSARAMARSLGIHHSTFQAYLSGNHRPAPHIRARLARLAGELRFDVLLDKQMKKCFGSFYVQACEHQQQEMTAKEQRVMNVIKEDSNHLSEELEEMASLNEDEARYFEAKLRTKKAQLERQRTAAAKRLELERQYREDDRLAARIAKQRLDQSVAVLNFLESHGSTPEIIELQRASVAQLEREYNSLSLRVDTVISTAPLFARMALAETDAAIKWMEERLSILEELRGGSGFV